MTNRTLLAALALVAVSLLALEPLAAVGQDQTEGDKAPQKTEQDKKQNTAVIPKAFNPKRHEQFVAIAKKGDIDVLLMGDSITDFWRNAGKTVYEKHFAPLKAANFGISGDRTQGVLWRMDNGELEGYTPKLMMLMIGTNNIGSNTPEEIAEGIKAVVDKFRGKFPEAKVLLLGVFPRSASPKSAQRTAVENINKIIAKYDDGKFIRYMDLADKFLDKDGTLPKTVMPDGLHPNQRGYEIWAEAVMPTIHEMLGKKD